MAKPYACDTRRGLCVRCCGAFLLRSAGLGESDKPLVLVEVAWDGLSVEGESPVDENSTAFVELFPRVAAGPWNLL